jgi:hypothetical protein
MYAFLRSFGFVWGVTIPSLVFGAFFDKNVSRISDAGVRQSLSGGHAYGSASIAYATNFPPALRAEIETVYRLALQMVWRVAIGFALLGFILSFGSRQLELRKETQTDYQLEGEKSARGMSAHAAQNVTR